MSSWEPPLCDQAEINPPRRTPKLTVAASESDASICIAPCDSVQAIAEAPRLHQPSAVEPAEDGGEFEHVLDEQLSALRAQLVLAHQRALKTTVDPCFSDFFPLQVWATEATEQTTITTCNSNCGWESFRKEREHSSVGHVAKWASLCGKLLDSSGSATPRMRSVREPADEWVLHRVWKTPVASRQARRNATNRLSAIDDLQNMLALEKSGELKESDNIIDRFVVHPDGFFRYFWSILGTVLLIYDGVTIPMELVELLDGTPSSLALGTFMFWVVDLLIQLLTGFHENGVVEVRFVKTSQRYLRTWCAHDVIILIIDLFFLFADSIEYAKAGKSMRIMRNIRVLRLARVGRLHRISEFINYMSTRIFSEYVAMLVKISQLIILLVAVNHYIACMWYGLGKAGDDETWLTEFSETWLTEFAVERKLYLYAVSLHWSLTQFSPATNNVSPRNFGERLFAISVVMFALVYFSSFISSVTNSVKQLKMYGQDRRKERARIREFISRKGISTDLGSRIQVFFDEQYAKVTRPLQEQDITFFGNIPETLRIRLHEEIFLPWLLEHQPFKAFSRADPSLLTSICHVAMAEKHFIPQEDVFVKRIMAQKARIVIKGDLDYAMGDSLASFVVAGTWASEQALYVQWTHSGNLTAVTSCELAEIDCEQFHTLVARHTRTAFQCFQLFANFFVTSMEAAVEAGCLISDVDIDRMQFDRIAERCVALYHKMDRVNNGEAAHPRRKPWSMFRSRTSLMTT